MNITKDTRNYSSQIDALARIIVELRQTTAAIGVGATEATLLNAVHLLATIDADTSVLALLSKNSGAVDANTLRVVLEDSQSSELSNLRSIDGYAQNIDANIHAIESRITSCDTDTILAAINLLDRNIGAATANSQRVVLENGSRNNIDLIRQYLYIQNFLNISGNTVEYTWTPSALILGKYLLSTETYKTGPSTIITKTYSYDPVTETVTSVSTL